jgi:hypothetical protein
MLTTRRILFGFYYSGEYLSFNRNGMFALVSGELFY